MLLHHCFRQVSSPAFATFPFFQIRRTRERERKLTETTSQQNLIDAMHTDRNYDYDGMQKTMGSDDSVPFHIFLAGSQLLLPFNLGLGRLHQQNAVFNLINDKKIFGLFLLAIALTPLSSSPSPYFSLSCFPPR